MAAPSALRRWWMTTDLIHRISIAAATETIYRALTTEDGIRAWWPQTFVRRSNLTRSPLKNIPFAEIS
jgi:uncharacterized protein YndB with AHSA1/START domain